MRKDITVQRINNEFTVEVYEVNVRISLEGSDINYFNQCLSQLFQLYRSGLVSINKHVTF